MQFSLTFLLTALISFTFAQNPFLYNAGDLTSLTAGSTFTIQWAPSTGTTDTVTLLLRQGDPSSLVTVLTVAGTIPSLLSILFPFQSHRHLIIPSHPSKGRRQKMLTETSKHTQHRLLHLVHPHHPRKRNPLHLRNLRRPKPRSSKLLESIYHCIFQYRFFGYCAARVDSYE